MRRVAGYLTIAAGVATTALFLYAVVVSLTGRFEGGELQNLVFLIGLTGVVSYLLWSTGRRLLRREESEELSE